MLPKTIKTVVISCLCFNYENTTLIWNFCLFAWRDVNVSVGKSSQKKDGTFSVIRQILFCSTIRKSFLICIITLLPNNLKDKMDRQYLQFLLQGPRCTHCCQFTLVTNHVIIVWIWLYYNRYQLALHGQPDNNPIAVGSSAIVSCSTKQLALPLYHLSLQCQQNYFGPHIDFYCTLSFTNSPHTVSMIISFSRFYRCMRGTPCSFPWTISVLCLRHKRCQELKQKKNNKKPFQWGIKRT